MGTVWTAFQATSLFCPCLPTIGLPVFQGGAAFFCKASCREASEDGGAGCPRGASRSLPIRLAVGRLWRREGWAHASRMAASLEREKTEHGKGAELSKQSVSFWASRLLVLSRRIKLICWGELPGAEKCHPYGSAASLGLTEHLALPGGGHRALRLGNVELKWRALSQMIYQHSRPSPFGFFHGCLHSSISPRVWLLHMPWSPSASLPFPSSSTCRLFADEEIEPERDRATCSRSHSLSAAELELESRFQWLKSPGSWLLSSITSQILVWIITHVIMLYHNCMLTLVSPLHKWCIFYHCIFWSQQESDVQEQVWCMSKFPNQTLILPLTCSMALGDSFKLSEPQFPQEGIIIPTQDICEDLMRWCMQGPSC